MMTALVLVVQGEIKEAVLALEKVQLEAACKPAT
jgi:hypothetical protein